MYIPINFFYVLCISLNYNSLTSPDGEPHVPECHFKHKVVAHKAATRLAQCLPVIP